MPRLTPCQGMGWSIQAQKKPQQTMGGRARELIGTEGVKSDGCSDKGDKAGFCGIPGRGVGVLVGTGFGGLSYSLHQSHSTQLDLHSSCLQMTSSRRSRSTKTILSLDMASSVQNVSIFSMRSYSPTATRKRFFWAGRKCARCFIEHGGHVLGDFTVGGVD